MRASRSVDEGGVSCQVVGCREPAAATPIEAELPSGSRLEVAVCGLHQVEALEALWLLDDLDSEDMGVVVA